MLVIHDDDIPWCELSATTCFQLAVHFDVAFLNRDLRLTATVNDSRLLEELIERDGPRIMRRHGGIFRIGCWLEQDARRFAQRVGGLSYAATPLVPKPIISQRDKFSCRAANASHASNT